MSDKTKPTDNLELTPEERAEELHGPNDKNMRDFVANAADFGAKFASVGTTSIFDTADDEDELERQSPDDAPDPLDEPGITLQRAFFIKLKRLMVDMPHGVNALVHVDFPDEDHPDYGDARATFVQLNGSRNLEASRGWLNQVIRAAVDPDRPDDQRCAFSMHT